MSVNGTDEVASDPIIREHTSSFALSDPITLRSALYGGRTETICLHAYGDDRSSIRYIDVTSLYPYVCKRKTYPIGHPKCLIGPELQGYTVNNIGGLIRCTVLPPRTMFIPLLPRKISGKLLFTLCRICAETKW